MAKNKIHLESLCVKCQALALQAEAVENNWVTITQPPTFKASDTKCRYVSITSPDSIEQALADIRKRLDNLENGRGDRLDNFYDQMNVMSIRIADLSRQVVDIALRTTRDD